MKPRSIGLFVTVAIVTLTCSSTSQVQAANITVKGGSCHALQFLPSPVPEPIHFADGSIANPTSDSRYTVVCDVPRQPLAAGATQGSFFVDGTNVRGGSTTCTLTSYNYTGSFLGSRSFTTSVGVYDQLVSLSSSELGTWAYIALTCSLPPDGNGSLMGVTSLQ